MSHHVSPLGALGRGLVAGAAGTAALTASQFVAAKVTGTEMPTAAGVVARRIAEGVFFKPVPDERLPVLNQAMHWTYGTAWGGVYGLAQSTLQLPAPHHGLLFGALLGTVGTAELPALGLMPPPWQVPPSALAINTFHHLMYGLAAAATFRALT